MRRELWPDGDDHDIEIAAFFAGALEEPEAILVAVGLRFVNKLR